MSLSRKEHEQFLRQLNNQVLKRIASAMIDIGKALDKSNAIFNEYLDAWGNAGPDCVCASA